MDDTKLTVRFKHGIHTIAMPVDSTKTVSVMTTQLLEILRDRYPEGQLRRSTEDEELKTTIPSEDDGDVTIFYAKAKNTEDNRFAFPADGVIEWTALKMKPHDTPSRVGIKNGIVVAFYFDEADWPPPVEFPRPGVQEDEEEEEEEEEEQDDEE